MYSIAPWRILPVSSLLSQLTLLYEHWAWHGQEDVAYPFLLLAWFVVLPETNLEIAHNAPLEYSYTNRWAANLAWGHWNLADTDYIMSLSLFQTAVSVTVMYYPRTRLLHDVIGLLSQCTLLYDVRPLTGDSLATWGWRWREGEGWAVSSQLPICSRYSFG